MDYASSWPLSASEGYMKVSEQASPHLSVRQPSVVVRGNGVSFAQEIVAGAHPLTADEPVAAGGTNSGPTPYDLLLAALGACTSMTVGMYARRKNWPLQGVIVRLRHARIHAEDCAACETEEGILDRIECELELAGPLSTEQRSKLLEISEKCPVHRTLQSRINIQSSLL
jgi:putative redox protein